MPDNINDTITLDIKPLEQLSQENSIIDQIVVESTEKSCMNDSISDLKSTDVLDNSKLSDSKFSDFKKELNYYQPEAVRIINETTPTRSTSSTYIENNLRAKRERTDYNDRNCTSAKKCLFVSKTKTSFKLGDVYKRIYKEDAKDAHNAEGDAITLMYIAAACGLKFFKWCDENSSPFYLVKPI